MACWSLGRSRGKTAWHWGIDAVEYLKAFLPLIIFTIVLSTLTVLFLVWYFGFTWF